MDTEKIGSIMTGTADVKQGQITGALKSLERAIENTESKVRALEEKIGSVLSASVPSGENEKSQEIPIPLVADIEGKTSKLNRINEEFQNILDRIEL